MEQEEIKEDIIKNAEEDFADASEIKPRWICDKPEEEAEVIKLQPGESVEGMLVDTFKSTKYNAMIFKIKVKDEKLLKILVGTTILDKLMLPKVVGDEVKIIRLDDTINQKGQSVFNWETYHLHKSSSEK